MHCLDGGKEAFRISETESGQACALLRPAQAAKGPGGCPPELDRFFYENAAKPETHGSVSVLCRGFPFQQCPLPVEPPTEATKSAIAPDHPVAGNDYGYGIRPAGRPYGTDGFGLTDTNGDITVRGG